MKREIATGLDQLDAGLKGVWSGARVGLLAHPASVTSQLKHAADVVADHSDMTFVAMFGPQHGFHGDKQDNMVESLTFEDERLRVPVYSLYGDVRRPTPEMLEGIDVMLFDLQDVGVRVYTFVWTMVLAMEACRDAGIAFVVLDRPNPITCSTVEGPMLESGYESFVGLHPIPLRHGLTVGELARWLNAERNIGCELHVVTCNGYSRELWFDETSCPWVLPSPNLPTLDACVVYPGAVLFEGTNLSEGRGTTRPFECIGAPFLDAKRFASTAATFDLPGVHFRPCAFEPTFQKHVGDLCGGVQIHVLDRDVFQPIQTAVTLLHVARQQAGDLVAWRRPPYEYETDKWPIDILWGGPGLREGIDAGLNPEEMLEHTATARRQFSAGVEMFHLYGDVLT